MVSGIARLPRPRPAICAPLDQRWASALKELRQLAPGTAWGAPMSETALDDLEDYVTKLRASKAAEPPSPMLQAACDEVWNLMLRWNAACTAIRNSQGFLRAAKTSWQHKLLDDIPVVSIPDPLSMEAGCLQHYDTVQKAKFRASELQRAVLWIEGLQSAISNAQAFDHQPTGDRAIELCEKLFHHVVALSARVQALEAKQAKRSTKSERKA